MSANLNALITANRNNNMEKRIVDDLIYKDLAYEIVGCFYDVYNEIGPGFKESIYHNALAIEFNSRDIECKEQKKIAVTYKTQVVGFYVPDFVIEEKVIVEVKAVDIMPKLYETQLFYYLKGTHYKLGYVVNFGGSEIDVRRRIFESARDEFKIKNIISGN